MVNKKISKIMAPSSEEDLRIKMQEILRTNQKTVEEHSFTETDVMKNLSGLYGDTLVYFVNALNNAEAQKALGLASEQDIKKITVVWIQTQTPPSKPFIEQAMRATSIFFETFHILHLTFDISEHVLVPKHRLITSPKERKQILEGYALTEASINQLPNLLPTDPVAKYYAFPMGSIVEVTRPGPLGPVLVHRVMSCEISTKTSVEDHEAKLFKKEVIHSSERKYTEYMSPSEYTMAIARTAADIARSEPPAKYLEGGDLRLLKIAKKMVDDQVSDVVISRAHINSNKEEHWHLKEMVLPKVT